MFIIMLLTMICVHDGNSHTTHFSISSWSLLFIVFILYEICELVNIV